MKHAIPPRSSRVPLEEKHAGLDKPAASITEEDKAERLARLHEMTATYPWHNPRENWRTVLSLHKDWEWHHKLVWAKEHGLIHSQHSFIRETTLRELDKLIGEYQNRVRHNPMLDPDSKRVLGE